MITRFQSAGAVPSLGAVFEILVEEGEEVAAGKTIASVESVKASSEIYAPASGKVSAVNKGLPDKPETLNSDPYGEGWLIAVHPDTPGEINDMLSSSEYLARASEADGS